MKKTLITAILSAALLLTGCAGGKEIGIDQSSNIADGGQIWTNRDSALETKSVPYTEEFAKEISEAATECYMPLMLDCEEHGQNPEGAPQVDIKIGGKDNHLYTGDLETYPRTDGKFFVIKPYGHVQSDIGYFEIYLFDDNGGTMIEACPNVCYASLCCDGEYFYYIFKDKLCRISEDGTVDEIVDFEVYDPEYPDDEIYPSVMDIEAEAEGDTLKVTVDFYSGVGTAYYYKTNTYIINVADLSVETHIGEFDVQKKPQSENSESEIQTTELTQEPDNEPTNENMTEDPLELEPSHYQSVPLLMYNGEIYYYIVGSHQVEIDGKYFEIDGEEVFIDAERMKNECEYIGKSISVTDEYMPTRELELTCVSSDLSCDLYKIDENQILAYFSEEVEIPESYSEWAIVYPGTYRAHLILLRGDKLEELQSDLVEQYYRYAERFPEDYAQEPESEQNNTTAE